MSCSSCSLHSLPHPLIFLTNHTFLHRDHPDRHPCISNLSIHSPQNINCRTTSTSTATKTTTYHRIPSEDTRRFTKHFVINYEEPFILTPNFSVIPEIIEGAEVADYNSVLDSLREEEIPNLPPGGGILAK